MEDFDLLLFDRIEMIKATIEKYGEQNFYISFSGGKDSTVLHYLIDEAIPNNEIPRVYINTGIEYNEIRMFVKKLVENDSRFVIFNSNINVSKMLKEKGYPFKSKEHSHKLSMFKRNGLKAKDCFKPKEEKADDEIDMVNHPQHYQHGIEPIDYIESHNLNFNLGNVIKYVSRAPFKGTELQDLKKAKWYLEREIKKHDN